MERKKKEVGASAHEGDIEDMGSISGLGRASRGGHCNPVFLPDLNPENRGAWWAKNSWAQRVRHDCSNLGRPLIRHVSENGFFLRILHKVTKIIMKHSLKKAN